MGPCFLDGRPAQATSRDCLPHRTVIAGDKAVSSPESEQQRSAAATLTISNSLWVSDCRKQPYIMQSKTFKPWPYWDSLDVAPIVCHFDRGAHWHAFYGIEEHSYVSLTPESPGDGF